ncbi:MAG: UvrD-helicase domain-containing protein [Candidatus Pacebacteria bacterium]|nr:UvrD-helicase domain-containing protein [Candidatus Paceibacterota bacterium]
MSDQNLFNELNEFNSTTDEMNTNKENMANTKGISETEYLKDLNPAQLEAALCTEGPLLILAGAGAGKTKTVTYRILHLIKTGVSPRAILAITFTNKAAREMRERVTSLLNSDQNFNLPMHSMSSHDYGDRGDRPFVSTFHSLGVSILKESGHKLGIPRHFVIYDRGDSKSAVKDALVELGHDPKQIDPNKILGIISREKGNFTSREEFEAKSGDDYMGSIAAEVWRKYDAKLDKDKALDFDDLLFKTAHLLSTHPEIREYYQKKWRYVHVDEYQDTNQVQYRIVQLLVGKNENLAVVGDGDQSIYGWRGADIKNILKFEEDYPTAKMVLLEQNYRSTQTILTAANKVIEKNIYRKKKNLFTKNEAGEKIKIYTAYDETDEANFIANTVREMLDKGTIDASGNKKIIKPDDIAVLYRANFQSRAIEDSFLRKNIAYTLLGTKFFERKEVKDVISYIRLALNPDSMVDVKRVINSPVRGIGKTTLLKVLEGKEDELPNAAKEKIRSFRSLLAAIEQKTKTDKASEVVKYVITMSGMEKSFKDEDEQERLENVRELVTLALKYDSYVQPEGIEKMLEEAALASDQDTIDEEKDKDKKPGVKLMTVHASKGLEFEYVFVTGLEQDLFPSGRTRDEAISPESSEEERRLFYVALTRAKKRLFLSHANVRTIFGNKQVTLPSEFLADIDEDLIEEEKPVTGIKSIFIDF